MALGIADRVWTIGELLDAALATQPIAPVPCTLPTRTANKHMLLSSEENGEPLASLWRMSPCGRLGPVFRSSAVQIGRYPGTRASVDPAYKVVRSGARAAETRWKDRTVIDAILGIDVSKNTD